MVQGNGESIVNKTVFLLAMLLSSAFTVNAQVYQNADLPDAMTFLDGSEVKTKADLEKRKTEIRKLWCDYFIGHYPEEAPKLLSAEVIKAENAADGSTRKRVVLTFDTPNKKSFEIEVWEPKSSNTTSRPLLLTQPRNYQRQKWGEEALKRGYVVCIYPGLDAHHHEKGYPGYEHVWNTFKSEYPKATWSSSLGIQAWLAGRTLDYLLDPKQGYKIDPDAVGITGFSRYGKQSIYAAAFDERFKCVVARSSGTPTACSYRFAGRQTFMESVSLEDCPKAWLIDKARTFYGRENELPVEGNALMACIAPRHLMIDTAYNDGSDPTFGVERSYLNAKKAWAFLGKEKNICLSYRKGNHNPITDEQVQKNLDYFDMAFGRGKAKASDFPEVLMHAFDWHAWKAKQRKSDLAMPEQASVRQKIEWMLGEQPASIKDTGKYHIKSGEELGVSDWSRNRWNPGGIRRVPFSFSGKMHGNIFFDPKCETYKATVIWLHPWNYSHGSNEGYGVQGTTVYCQLAKEGYKVVMYDQFGFGDHLTDAVGFYDKHPHWSRMGRAVYDVQKVIDFLVDGKGITAQPVPPTDPGKIYICGFAFGGMVGLYATALDERIAGIACFSGFTPMRTDTDAKPTGGIRQYWEWHALMPKLGLYHGKEATIPYDYDDVIGLIAPRKCLIYSPTRDRFGSNEDIKQCVMKAKASWHDEDALTFISPDDICRFQHEQQDALVRWLEAMLKRDDLMYYGPERGAQPGTAPASRREGLARPTKQQLAFLDWELGLFIHYGLSTYTGQPAGDGKQSASRFNPTHLDCDSWMETAKAMGATYAVLTTRHEGGFCTWPTESTEYCVRNSPWKDGKGDVVREFVDACRRHGIRVGFYHTASHDAHHRRLVKNGTITEERYAKIQLQQIEELFTNYGPVDYIWQDHHSGIALWKSIDDKIAELQPNCLRLGPDVWLNGRSGNRVHVHMGVVFHPLWYGVNTTDGTIYSRPDETSHRNGRADGTFFRAWEANCCITGGWFWCGPQKPSCKTMIDKYYNSVGLGANLLLNFAPDPSGKISDNVLQVAREFGDTIRRRFADPLGSMQSKGQRVVLDLGREKVVATVVTMEEISTGQRIAEYAIEAEVNGAWREIASGQTIGHKKIEVITPTIQTRCIRFVCRKVAPRADIKDVAIRNFTAYGPPRQGERQ